MKKLLVIIICIISIKLVAQNDKYPYTYSFEFPPQSPSFCVYKIDTLLSENNYDSTKFITIRTLDNDLNVSSFIPLQLITFNRDTLYITTDIDGIVKTRLQSQDFQILLDVPGYTFLKANVTNLTNEITIFIGNSGNNLHPPILRSKRKLTEKELKDISINKNNSRLVKNKICYLYFQL